MENSGSSSTLSKIAESSYLGARQIFLVFTLGHPLDLAKTRSQSNPYKAFSFTVLKQIRQHEGIRGWYKGGSMNFSRMLLKETYRSPLRGFIKQLFGSNLPSNQDLTNVLTGLTMAMSDTFILCPLERIKVWMMTTERGQSSSLKQYFMPKDTTLGSFRLRDLFCGLEVSFFRSAISWVSFLVIEENIRRSVLAKRQSLTGEPTIPEQIFIGTVCGVLNSVITLPLDAVKTQIQRRPEGLSINDRRQISQTFKHLVKIHGVSGLYAGFQFKLPHYVIVAILTSGNIQRIDKIWTGTTSSES
jgi:hypothetical protein